MAITSYPFDNQDVSESQYSALFRELQDSGIVGDSSSTAFKLTTDASGLDVQVAAGMAIVRGHAIISDAPITVTPDAAHATLPRIDRVVLRLDPVANGISVELKAGTPAASPLAPGLTYTDTGIFEVALGEVRVEAAALNVLTSNITDQRTWVGQRIGLWKSATRPGSPRKARLGFNEDTGSWEYWNGAAWGPIHVTAPTTITVPHTFTLSGEVAVAAGDIAYVPPFFIPVPPGQTVRLRSVRHRINSGTSATVKLTSNGTDLTGYTGIAVTTTTATTDAADVTLTNNAALALVVTAVSGTPKNLSLTLYLDYVGVQ